ncbi:hypothetical protein IWQ61_007962 [Dispira simplex]|nr:hypothetical protein IWQ61_007962 [Dispira simplex]
MAESTSLTRSLSNERPASKSATFPSSPQSGVGSPRSTVSAPAMSTTKTETSAVDKRRQNTKKIVFRLIGLGMDEEQLLQRNVNPGIIQECLQEHREKQRGSSVVSDIGQLSLALSAPNDEEGEIVRSLTVEHISLSPSQSPVVTAVTENDRPVSPGVDNSIVISDESDEEGEVIEEEGLIRDENSHSYSLRLTPDSDKSSEEEGEVDMDTDGSESPPPVRQQPNYTVHAPSPAPHNRPNHHYLPTPPVQAPMGAANYPQHPHSYPGLPNPQMVMSSHYQQNAQMYLAWYAQRVLQNTASHYGQNVTVPALPWVPHTSANYRSPSRSRTTSSERPSPPRENLCTQSVARGSNKHSSTLVTPAMKEFFSPKDPRLDLRGASPTLSDPGVKTPQGPIVTKPFVRSTNNVQDFMLSDDDSDDADAGPSNNPLDSGSTFVAPNEPRPALGNTQRSSKVDHDAMEKARSLLAVQEQRIAEMKERIQRMESSQKASPPSLTSTTSTQDSLSGVAEVKVSSQPVANGSATREKRTEQTGPPRGFFARRVAPVAKSDTTTSAPPQKSTLSLGLVNGSTFMKESASLMASEAKLREQTQYTKQLFDKYDEHLNIVSELRALMSQAARDLVNSQEAYEQANQKLDTLQAEVREERAAWLRERQVYLAREVSPANDTLPVVATLNSLKRKLGQLQESIVNPHTNPTQAVKPSSLPLTDPMVSSEPDPVEDIADTVSLTSHESRDSVEPGIPPAKVQKLSSPTLESVAPSFVKQVKQWAKLHLVDDFGNYLRPLSAELALDLTAHVPNMQIPTSTVQWHQVSTIKPFHRIGGFLDYDHSRWLWPNDIFLVEELAKRLGVHSTSETKLDASEADALLDRVDKDHPFQTKRGDPEPTSSYFPRSTHSLELQSKYRYAKSASDLKTMSVASKIDPMRPLCVFETTGGECRDPQCQSLHFRDLEASPDETLCELLQWNEGEGTTGRKHYYNGLMMEMYFFIDKHPNASVNSAIDCILKFRAHHFGAKSRAMKSLKTAENSVSEASKHELALVGSDFMKPTVLQRAFTQRYIPITHYWQDLVEWVERGMESITSSTSSRASTPTDGSSSVPVNNTLPKLLAQAQSNTQVPDSCPWISPSRDPPLTPDLQTALVHCLHKAIVTVRRISRKASTLEEFYQFLREKQFAKSIPATKGRYSVLPLVQALRDSDSEYATQPWFQCVAVLWYTLRVSPHMLCLWLTLVDLLVGAAHEVSSDWELAKSSKNVKTHMVALFQFLLERFPYEPSLWWRYFCWEEHRQRKDRHLCQMLVHFADMPIAGNTFSHHRSRVLGTILVALFQFRLSQLSQTQSVLDWFYNLLVAPSKDVVRQLLLVDPTQTKEFSDPPPLVLSASSWIGQYLSPTVLAYVLTTYTHTVIFRALPIHLFGTSTDAYFLVDPEQLFYVDWAQTQHLSQVDETGTPIENRLDRVQDILAHLLLLPAISACPVSFAALTYNYWGVLQAVGCPPSVAISALDNICSPGETKPPEVCEILFQLHQDAYYTPDGADRLYFEQVVNRHPYHVAVWNRLAKLVWSATQDPHRVAELLSRAANACFNDRDPIAHDWRFLGVTLAMYNQCMNEADTSDGQSSVPSGLAAFEQVPSHLQMRMLLLEGPDIAGPVTVAELKAFHQCKAELPSLGLLRLDLPLRQLLAGQLTTLLLLMGENLSRLADPLYPVTLDALYSPEMHGVSQVTFLPRMAKFRFQCELLLWCEKREEEVIRKSIEQCEGDDQTSGDDTLCRTKSSSEFSEGGQVLLALGSSHTNHMTNLTALQTLFEHTRTVQLGTPIWLSQPLLRNHHRYTLDQLMFTVQNLVTTVLHYVPKSFRVDALVYLFENHAQNLHLIEELVRTLWNADHRIQATYFLLLHQKRYPEIDSYNFLYVMP